jgi:muramoyltetrapeptide carboxypeptidase
MPQDFERIVPAPLAAGARVAVIAPAGPCDRELLERGIAWLGERYRVEFDPGIFAQDGYLAGSDARRLSELDRALAEPGLGAVLATRGGYGLTRIVERANFAALRREPKWLVGFSDVTALHVEALRAGCASLHAANVGSLGVDDAPARQAFVRALEMPTPRSLAGLECWTPGVARGPLVGGNLCVLATCATAGRLRWPPGALVALEDVTESAYRVDRLLTSLFQAGHFDRVSGVVLGDFTDCPPSRHVEVREVLVERLACLRVPVAAGLRFGHGAWNEPLPFGVAATLDAARGELLLGAE